MTAGIDYETHYENLAEANLELEQLRRKVATLEQSLRDAGEHHRNIAREISHHRNLANRMDQRLIAHLERKARGPVTEKEIGDFVTAQKYLDHAGSGEPVEVTWEGLHPWHRIIITETVQAFTRRLVAE